MTAFILSNENGKFKMEINIIERPRVEGLSVCSTPPSHWLRSYKTRQGL